jgi:hypothetical protein
MRITCIPANSKCSSPSFADFLTYATILARLINKVVFSIDISLIIRHHFPRMFFWRWIAMHLEQLAMLFGLSMPSPAQ